MFYTLLKKQLLEESSNYYPESESPRYNRITVKKRVINLGKRIFYSRLFINLIIANNYLFKEIFLGKVFSLKKYLNPLESFYNKLETDASKKLLLKLMAFRILGYVKVKLPLNTKEYWNGLEEVYKNEGNEFIELDYAPFKLPFHDLTNFSFPIKVYLHSKALYMTFMIHHYDHKIDNTHTIKVEKDDVVLDLGGCYGDSSLYFANLAGENGKVYSFEFIPSNLEVLNKNLALNPTLKHRIEIVDKPLWDVSGKKVFYSDLGASSKVGFENSSEMSGQTETLSLDDFVNTKELKRLDFIKTDIEGAEPFAIKGAIKSISKFKPKLAISIYHNMSDFTGIVNQIDELNLGYKFYLGHATTYSSETVLFCTVN